MSSITYDEAMATLSSMFGVPSGCWSKTQLDRVLRHFDGHMENTVECILSSMGNGESPEDVIHRLQTGLPSSTTTTTTTTTTTNNPQRRGKPTELPPDFLRIPQSQRSPSELSDEQLARSLQREEEAAIRRRNTNTTGDNWFQYPGSSRTVPPTNNNNGPAAAIMGLFGGGSSSATPAGDGMVSPSSVVDKLAEVGETTKRHLGNIFTSLQQQQQAAKRPDTSGYSPVMINGDDDLDDDDQGQSPANITPSNETNTKENTTGTREQDTLLNNEEDGYVQVQK